MGCSLCDLLGVVLHLLQIDSSKLCCSQLLSAILLKYLGVETQEGGGQ